MKKPGFIFLFLFILNIFSLEIVAQEINLVEVKKKEEQRRNKIKKSKYSLNNGNLFILEVPVKKYSFVQVMATSYILPEFKEKLSEKNELSEEGGKSENSRQYWQDIKNRLQNEINSLNEKIRTDQLNLNKIISDFYSMDLPFQKNDLRNQIHKLSNSLSNDKTRLKTLQDDLEYLPTKARKAGVPPGWIR